MGIVSKRSFALLILLFLFVSMDMYSQTEAHLIKRSNPQIDKRWQEGGVYNAFTPEKEELLKRSEKSKTFKNSDNTFSAVLGGVVHYKDENDAWQDVNYHVAQNNSEKFVSHEYCNITAKHKSYFPGKAGNKGVVMNFNNNEFTWWENPEMKLVEQNGKEIFLAKIKPVTASLLENKLHFNEAYPGITEEFVVLEDGTGIENNTIIHYLNDDLKNENKGSKLVFTQFVPLSSEWLVITDAEIKTSAFSCESFAVKKSQDEKGIVFNPVVIFDNNFDKMKALESLKDIKINGGVIKSDYFIEFVDGGIIVSISLNQSWLLEVNRSFPVTIDPAITIGSITHSTTALWNGFYADTRLQALYLSSYLNDAGLFDGDIITAIAIPTTLDVDCDETHTGLKIRLQNTALTTFTEFINAGYTDCYSGSRLIENPSQWYSHTLSTTFTFDISQNLIIDFSMNMAARLSSVNQNKFILSDVGAQQHWNATSTTDAGDPQDWGGASGSGFNQIPYINITFTASSTTWDGSTDSDWGTPSNWSNGVPDANHPAIITTDGTSPVIDETAACYDLTINAGAKLTLNTGADLSVANILTVSGGSPGGEFELNAGTCTVTADFEANEGGVIDVNGGMLDINNCLKRTGSNWTKGIFELSGGTIDVVGNCYFSGSGLGASEMEAGFNFVFADGLYFANNWTFAGPTYATITMTAATDGFAYLAPNNDGTNTLTFPNLVVDAAGGTVLFTRSSFNTDTYNIKGDLTITAGEVRGEYWNNPTSYFVGTIDVDGDVEIGASGELDVYGSGNHTAVEVAGDWTNNGILQSSSATITFNGTSTQTINAGGKDNVNKDFGHVIIDGSDVTLTSTNMEVLYDLVINAGKKFTMPNLLLDIGYDLNVLGTYEQNDGTCTIVDDFETETGCTVDLNGGIINIGDDWRRVGDDFAKGTIQLGGDAEINVIGNARFSSSLVDGYMEDSFVMTVGGDNLYMSADEWGTVTGGTIVLTGLDASDDTVSFRSSSSGDNVKAWNLIINGTAKVFELSRYESNVNYYILNDFTITDGTVDLFDEDGYYPIFDVDGNITIGASGTLIAYDALNDNNAPILVAGNWDNSAGGTFTSGSNTVTFNGAAAQTINAGGKDDGDKDFYNVIIDGSDVTLTTTNMEVLNDFTINAAKKFTMPNLLLDIGNDMLISGEYEQTNGVCAIAVDFESESGSTVDIDGGTLDINGDWRSSGSVWASGTIELSGGTIDVASDVCWNASSGGVSGTMNGAFEMTVGNDFYMCHDAWSDPTGGTIIMTASEDGNVSCKSGNVGYDVKVYNLTINGSGDNFWFTRPDANRTCSVYNDFTVTAGTAHISYTDYYTTLDVEGNVSIGASGTLDADNTVDGLVKCKGDWDNSGSFISGDGTVTFDGAGAQTINAGGKDDGDKDFYNVIIDGSDVTLTSTNMEVLNEFTINASKKFTMPNLLLDIGLDLSVSGEYQQDDGTCAIADDLESEVGCTVDINGGTLTVADDWRKIADSWAKGTIELSGGAIDVASSVMYSGSGITGTMDGAFVMTVGNSFYLDDDEWATITAGTVIVTASEDGDAYVTSPNAGDGFTVYNLIVNGNTDMFHFSRSDDDVDFNVKNDFTLTAGTVDLCEGANFATLNVDGDIVIGANGILDADNTNDAPILLAGNWDNSAGGTFISGSNTVTFNGTSTITTGGVGDGQDFNNVILNGVSATMSANPIDIDGAISLTAGIWTTSNLNMNVAGNWTNDATFTSGTNTVTFDGGSEQTIDAGGTAVGQDFNYVIINGAGATLANTDMDVDQDFTITSGVFDMDENLNLTIGGLMSASGEYQQDDGTCSITGDLESEAGCTIDIDGGNYNIGDNWKSSGSNYAKGTIELSGGAISVAKDANFFNADVSGTMNGPFTLTIGDDFRLTDANWSVPTGGTVILTHTYVEPAPAVFASVVNDGTISVYNLTINADGGSADDFCFARDNNVSNVHIYNDFTQITGTVSLANLGVGSGYTEFTVDGDFSIGAGESFNATTRDAPIQVGGNWTNNGTFLPYDNTVTFNGTTAQSITGATTFHDLLISKASEDLTLNNAVSVDGTVTLTSGDIITSTANLLTVTDDDDPGISGGSTISHINGPVKKLYTSTSAITFPVGDGTIYMPVMLTPSTAGAEEWTVEYKNVAHATADICVADNLHHRSDIEYWNIDRANTIDAKVRLYWDATSKVKEGAEIADLRIAHYNGGSSCWEEATANVTTNTTLDYIESDAALTDFSPITLSSTEDDQTLPIDLLDFTVLCNSNSALLVWTTATETNNDFFTVQTLRGTSPQLNSPSPQLDSDQWQTIATIPGAGNSTTTINYEYIDNNNVETRHASSNLFYYRIKQTDYNGKSTYSESKTVNCGGGYEETNVLLSQNNINGNVLNYKIYTSEQFEFNVYVINAVGQQLVSRKEYVDEENNDFQLPVSQLPSGIYIFRIESTKGNFSFCKNIIVSR